MSLKSCLRLSPALAALALFAAPAVAPAQGAGASPAGSQAAAQAAGVTMYLTGTRHFFH